jgi:hypothetical protein
MAPGGSRVLVVVVMDNDEAFRRRRGAKEVVKLE